jgi:hypothetical protein
MEQTTIQPMPSDVGFEYRPKEQWSDYDLQTYSVFFRGNPTNMQAIVYKGNFVVFRSKDYYVFPHEDIFATLHPVMEQLGMRNLSAHIPEHRRFTLAYGQNQKAEVESSYKVFNGKKIYTGAQLRATYEFKDEKFDVTGHGDIVQFGATIENTLDGTMSMRISPYSYRQVCSNGAMHLATVAEISQKILQNLRNKFANVDGSLIRQQMDTIMQESRSFDDLVSRIKKERMTHLTKIPVEWITSRIYLIKESVTGFKQRYREMTDLLVTQQQAELIAERMPKRLVDSLEWLDVKKEKVDVKTAEGTKTKMETEIRITGKPTQWKAFNDITENLTHVERAFHSKSYAYKQLDAILVNAS